MSIFNILAESFYKEADELDLGADSELDLGSDEELDLGADEEPAPKDEEPVIGREGDPKALVDAMLKYAPGKSTEIKNMLKYAANSNTDYDIFDSALDYLESTEDKVSAKAKSKEEPDLESEPTVEDDLGDGDTNKQELSV